MGNHLVKFKRALALVLAFVMTVSVLTVAPSTEVSAASSKYVSTLKVSSSKFTLTSGKKKTIKATVKTKGSSVSKKVTASLSSADKKEVSVKVGKPSKSGVTNITIKAKTVTSKKTAKVKVTTVGKSKNNKKIVKTVTVTVKPAAVKVQPTAVKAAVTPSTIEVSQPAIVTAIVEPAGADQTVTFTSSNPAVATVDKTTGVVTGMGEGTAVITATASNGKSASVIITVKAAPVAVTGITLSETEVELTVGRTTNLQATVLPANATENAVTWTSKDQKVAKVDATGAVTALAEGTTEIVATTANGLSATCKVTVVKEDAQDVVVTFEVTNSLKDYTNTVLYGNNMTIRARVTTPSGQPLGGKDVMLSLKKISGGNNNNVADYEVRNDLRETDENGYATFSVLYDGNEENAVTIAGREESYTATVKDTASNAEYSAAIRFATIRVSNLVVQNNRDVSLKNIEPSKNATSGYDGIEAVSSMNKTNNVEYVSSQQVSTASKDHTVYFKATPYIILPVTKEPEVRGEWTSVVNKTSGAISIYNDENNTTTTAIVTDIPKGLEYITLSFDKVSLSKYTKLRVSFYKEDGTSAGTPMDFGVEKNGTSQIQIEDKALLDSTAKITVSLISEGQVDTSNEGYVLKELTGKYKNEKQTAEAENALTDAVTWSNVSELVKGKYETFAMNTDEVSAFKANDSLSNAELDEMSGEGTQFSYKLPVFPYVGNAVITVKDANDTVLAMYSCPIKQVDNKHYIDLDENNEIIRISSQQANDVATVDFDTKGELAVVNTTKAGFTALMCDIKLDSTLSDEEFNDQNGAKLYTFVQWAPVAKVSETTDAPDFFAIEGQSVDVVAGLYDENDNKVSVSGADINFTYGNGTVIDHDSVNTLYNGSDSCSPACPGTLTTNKFKKTTNAEGEVVLTLTGTDMAHVEKLTATSTGYVVKLTLAGSEAVDEADIYWMDMGLAYDDDVDDIGAETNFKSSNVIVNRVSTYKANSKWDVGFVATAQSHKFKSENVKKVSGVTLDYKKGTEEADTTLTVNNNVATVTSQKAGITEITGSYKADMDASGVAVTYEISGKTYEAKNVGKGKVDLSATQMTLPIIWEATGMKVELFSSNQNTIVSGDATQIVCKVTDQFGNPYDAAVEITANGESLNVDSTTGADGYIVFDADTQEPGSIIYNAKIANNVEATLKIEVVENKANEDIDLVSANLVDGEANVIELVFNNNININTVQKEMFTISENGKIKYIVKDIKEGSKSNSIKLVVNTAVDEVAFVNGLMIEYKSINDKVSDTETITYAIVDRYGQVFGVSDYVETDN